MTVITNANFNTFFIEIISYFSCITISCITFKATRNQFCHLLYPEFPQELIFVVSFFQLTYSMTRFAIYETVKNQLLPQGQPMAFYQKVLLGGFAGCVGGLVGTPADLTNVRYVSFVNPHSKANSENYRLKCTVVDLWGRIQDNNKIGISLFVV